MGEKLINAAIIAFFGSLVLACLLLIGGFGCSLFGGIDHTYSEGSRIGNITKWSNKGFVCKTWEGELNLGGLQNDGKNMVANMWEFSDPTGQFAAEINRLADAGTPVVVHYRQVLIRSAWNSNSDYYVTAIEPVAPKDSK